jgi:DsbC/DsbD-like thiol-disulfide interchange protein
MKRIVLLCAIVAMPESSQAASSDWFAADGARLRLVTADAAGTDGSLRGVLQIDLQPGWKTYWKDPGDAGIAPRIDVSASMNVKSAELSFPAPVRFREGDEVSIGYVQPVTLPVTFRLEDPERFTAIDADVLLGICKEICVPVQARLSVTPGGAADAADPAIDEGFARLPSPASVGFGLTGIRDEGTSLLADAVLPDGSAAADLFLVTPRGFEFGVPVLETTDGRRAFRIPVLDRPHAPAPAVDLHYTLVAGDRAVEGRSIIP